MALLVKTASLLTDTYAIPRLMNLRRLRQKAGRDSQQQQAEGDILNVYVTGISAADVVEITRAEAARLIREELPRAAERVAQARLEGFERRVVERFADDPQLRAAFADPDFQYSLRDAGRAATSNDDEHTEGLLVDLLANRAESGNSARVRLITSKAIQATDKLSIEALRGVTAQWALSTLTSGVPGALAVLESLNTVSDALLGMGLPAGAAWVEDIEALGLANVPVGGLVTRKLLRPLSQDHALPWLNTGIDPSTSQALIDSATDVCPWLGELMAPHPLKPEFITLPGKDVDEFRALVPPESAECQELEQLISQNQYGSRDLTATAEFTKRFDQRESLVAAAAWWDALPVLQLTVVGRAIGLLNARRYIPFSGAQTIAQMIALPEPSSRCA